MPDHKDNSPTPDDGQADEDEAIQAKKSYREKRGEGAA